MFDSCFRCPAKGSKGPLERHHGTTVIRDCIEFSSLLSGRYRNLKAL